MELSDYRLLSRASPTYLQEIFRTEENITLICDKECPDYLQEEIIPVISFDDETVHDVIELTGNPLPDNMADDADISINVKTPNNWTADEETHYPIDLSTARRLLSSINLQYSKEEDAAPCTTYCCSKEEENGDTVLIGCKPDVMWRTVIRSLGCLTKSDDNMSIDTMIREHSLMSDMQSKVAYEVTAVYVGNGFRLRDGEKKYSIAKSVRMETFWNSPTYELPTILYEASLIVQLVAGHKESPFHEFWQQLLLIHHAVDVLLHPANLDDFKASENPMSSHVIMDNVRDMMMQQTKKPILKKECLESLDINNLRHGDSLDKLWILLLDCENVDSIMECLTELFEEIAQNSFLEMRISENNTSSIAKILRQLMDGKLAVPTISCLESLQLFVELGMEKLKNDFHYILSLIDNVDRQAMTRQWSDLMEPNQPKIDSRITMASAKLQASRVTRMTIHSGGIMLTSREMMARLNYLGNLYVATEFAVYLKRNLSKPMLKDVFKSIIASYMGPKRTTTLNGLLENNLCEMTVSLKNLESSFLKSWTLSSWNFKMTSKERNSSVVTIRHHSKYPIFPRALVRNYHTSQMEGTLYHVTEAVTYIN